MWYIILQGRTIIRMLTTRHWRELIAANDETILHQLPAPVARPHLSGLPPERKALVLYGVRRAGKSFLLFDRYRQSPGTSLYLDFEDDRLAGCTLADCDRILEAFHAEKPGVGHPVFLLDEIQNVTGWERYVRRLVEKEGVRVIVTGSSSRVMPQEFHTALRGRAWSREVLPYSFTEYLTACGTTAPGSLPPPGRKRAARKNHFLDYLHYGGFPEVAAAASPYLKRKLVSDYLDAMYFRDLVERFNLTNIPLLEALRELLFASFATRVSVSSFCRHHKGRFPFARDSAFHYYHCFLQSLLVREVRCHTESSYQRLRNPAQCYLADTGLARHVTSTDEGRLLENAVFLELQRRGHELWYHGNGGECDFVARHDSGMHAIQVAWEVHPGNQNREIDGLLSACKRLALPHGTIITAEQEGEEVHQGVRISIVPAWRWFCAPT